MPDAKRPYLPSVLFLPACILAYRANDLIVTGAPLVRTPWVTAALFAGIAIVAATMVVYVLWWRDSSTVWARRALVLTSAVVVVHALRVAVFALGHVGRWVELDVRPEHRARRRRGLDLARDPGRLRRRTDKPCGHRLDFGPPEIEKAAASGTGRRRQVASVRRDRPAGLRNPIRPDRQGPPECAESWGQGRGAGR